MILVTADLTVFCGLCGNFGQVICSHGHIHLYSPNENQETKYFHTMVINVYDHYVLTVH